jgi:hypothetical protein
MGIYSKPYERVQSLVSGLTRKLLQATWVKISLSIGVSWISNIFVPKIPQCESAVGYSRQHRTGRPIELERSGVTLDTNGGSGISYTA